MTFTLCSYQWTPPLHPSELGDQGGHSAYSIVCVIDGVLHGGGALLRTPTRARPKLSIWGRTGSELGSGARSSLGGPQNGSGIGEMETGRTERRFPFDGSENTGGGFIQHIVMFSLKRGVHERRKIILRYRDFVDLLHSLTTYLCMPIHHFYM